VRAKVDGIELDEREVPATKKRWRVKARGPIGW